MLNCWSRHEYACPILYWDRQSKNLPCGWLADLPSCVTDCTGGGGGGVCTYKKQLHHVILNRNWQLGVPPCDLSLQAPKALHTFAPPVLLIHLRWNVVMLAPIFSVCLGEQCRTMACAELWGNYSITIVMATNRCTDSCPGSLLIARRMGINGMRERGRDEVLDLQRQRGAGEGVLKDCSLRTMWETEQILSV